MRDILPAIDDRARGCRSRASAGCRRECADARPAPRPSRVPTTPGPQSGPGPRIVAIGGGTGLPNVLRGLRPLLFPDGAPRRDARSTGRGGRDLRRWRQLRAAARGIQHDSAGRHPQLPGGALGQRVADRRDLPVPVRRRRGSERPRDRQSGAGRAGRRDAGLRRGGRHRRADPRHLRHRAAGDVRDRHAGRGVRATAAC